MLDEKRHNFVISNNWLYHSTICIEMKWGIDVHISFLLSSFWLQYLISHMILYDESTKVLLSYKNRNVPVPNKFQDHVPCSFVLFPTWSFVCFCWFPTNNINVIEFIDLPSFSASCDTYPLDSQIYPYPLCFWIEIVSIWDNIE